MRPVQSEYEGTEGDDALLAVLERISTLFARYPALTGFSVQGCGDLIPNRPAVALNGNLCLADVAVHAWPSLDPTPAWAERIADAIRDLLDAHPEADELLRGSTFARSIH